MKNKVNFYEKSISEIKYLIKKNNYDSAYKLVSKELNMPYIPEKYAEQYEKLFLEINRHVYENNSDKIGGPTAADIKGIKKGLSLDNDINIFDRHRFLRSVNNINLRLVKKELKDFFLAKKIPTYLKIILIESLQKQEIFDEYNIYLSNKIHLINIKKHKPIYKRADYQKTFEIGKEQLFKKNPNLFSQLKIIANIYYISIFPKKINQNNAVSISCALILYICEIYNINDFTVSKLSLYYNISERTINSAFKNLKSTMVIHKNDYLDIKN